ncbi:MAG: TRAP transporter substrate-binding protein [Gammaproteobacteria bacterium]|nr:TRAP transporter substrate-binding protein [Gammaproteobacteria bacterium]MBU1466210.1 TRAP transporter substrate-binding protein [Gammaproteobacteria bacterium]MBU2024255.1 TRAP transporter substrate-binding protein [Gammaproteobacteria bacterium]MBU2238793.1 TRAP transporter substrate-binding protein [Gammaproteobacteria bacterium]MBU2317396.1 TRAP transporter substrate-binding protein [Gammaproteobacteria bacterium]
MIKIIKHAAITVVAASAIVSAQANASAEYTLRFSHFFPELSDPSQKLFIKWAEAVEAESNGRIDVQMYPSSTLAKPPAQYDAVKNSIADVTVTVQGYTANRFPLTQIVELPGVSQNAAQGSCVVQSLYDEGLISDEYNQTKPLFLFTHGPGGLHTTNKEIKVPQDLEGLRIRRPTAVVAKLLEGLGAQPVGMPAPDAYQSAQRGVIDGVALPWEGEYTFRLNELTPYHTEVGGLYTLAFVMTINKSFYNRLPLDLKKVIDHNSGMEWSKKAATVFDDLDAKGRAQAIEMGHKITVIEDGAENPLWKPVLYQATEEYLDELQKKGLPSYKVYARAVELSKTACK